MPRNGSGTYTAPTNSFNPAVSGTTIDPTDWNSVLQDVEDALTASVAKDGQTAMTGDLSLGGNDITNVATITTTGVGTFGGNVVAQADVSVTGEVFLAAGTNSAPSLSFTGDTNTGIYKSTADTVDITAGGTVRLTVDGVTPAVNLKAAVQRAGTAAYLLKNRTVITSSTTYSTPANVRALRFIVIGGGGGGGGVDGQGAGTSGAGGGGGAGGYVDSLTTSAAASYTVTVGALGAGGTAGANNGSAGGNSSVTDGVSYTLTANGGSGGAGFTGSSSNTAASGGAGGSASGGDINIDGQVGGLGRNISPAVSTNDGGSTPLGYGGKIYQNIAGSDGTAATGYGAGGSGAVVGAVATNYAGGAGTAGVVIVEEYY